MRYLLDTHFLLWLAEESPRLPGGLVELIEDPENQLFFSVVSIWEIAIKVGRRPNFDITAALLRRYLLDSGYEELVVQGDHATAVESLPDIHKDPFDRILIAQAFVEGLSFLTADKTVARYGGLIQLM
jgi:PIN domain nuclease of toxin-antitoxin system